MPMEARPVRIGLVYAGGGWRRAAWSGVLGALAAGMGEAGVEVSRISADPPRTWHRALVRLGLLAEKGPAKAVLRTRQLRRELTADSTDGFVQLGTSYRMPASHRFVTLEDMTVVQAEQVGARDLDGVSRRHRQAWRLRQRDAYRDAVACCVGSRWAKASIVGDYGISPANVHVVGFGRNYDPPPGARAWEPARFLWIGGDWARKNGERVVAAFARLRAERPGATLDLVGGHPRVGVEGVSAHGALRLGVPAERARLDALYRRATCLVMPSLYEPFGIAYVDAAAAGVPSIGTVVGGAADAIGDGGRLVDPADEADLLSAMRELAEPRVASTLGANAARRAGLFTRKAVAERLLRALALPQLGSQRLAGFL